MTSAKCSVEDSPSNRTSSTTVAAHASTLLAAEAFVSTPARKTFKDLGFPLGSKSEVDSPTKCTAGFFFSLSFSNSVIVERTR